MRQAGRAKIVLLAATDMSNQEIVAKMAIKPQTVGRWRSRLAQLRLVGAEKALSLYSPAHARKREIICKTTQQTPKNATNGSTRSLDAEMGLSQSLVPRVWKSNSLKSHLVRTFKLIRDPLFEEKLIIVVGFYLNPSDKVLVLSVDEKSQIQALDRTQPDLPILRGRCGAMRLTTNATARRLCLQPST